jgi:DNA-binding NarL/FixJ family response regulator
VDGCTLIVADAGDRHRKVSNGSSDEIVSRLTGRELEIAVLVAQGFATKNIAYRLQISEWTVSTYLRRIFAKLGVDSRAAMVYRCATLIEKFSS